MAVDLASEATVARLPAALAALLIVASDAYDALDAKLSIFFLV